eukprot:CAMPEP_0118724052 /NCGR_PEP_ID=MMETSP0800-20121206/32344_1 /TAXON_ID=210618 ORGANISM="Striatella unipunctata, Strain CCMP2910" /NCGR_SAMPLE_ID=MMETSP0800 /ASSEMBLY_ACC=CAM_ASM_000638 /LENGTH=373 /DNA_ID=CAMNT_0006632545 /DNA_START=401 /DNA_END=1522 /DNA_ORIENTATION=+
MSSTQPNSKTPSTPGVEENKDTNSSQAKEPLDEAKDPQPKQPIPVDKKKTKGKRGSTGASEDDGSDESIENQQTKLTESLGNKTEGTIGIGSDHQVVVPPFTGTQPVESRNPTLVWKTNAVTQDAYEDYILRAEKILSGFIQSNGMERPSKLTTTRPRKSNTPLVFHDRAINVDKLFDLLHQKEYDATKALGAITATPREYIDLWTENEIKQFADFSRKTSGSLRIIAKNIPTRNFKSIVDYQYRFLTPEQHCLQEEKSREEALHMIECIEKRCFDSVVVRMSATGEKKARDWYANKTGNAPSAVENREDKAMTVILEIRDKLEPNKYEEFEDTFEKYHANPALLNTKFRDLLSDHRELYEKIQAFLPRRLRN